MSKRNNLDSMSITGTGDEVEGIRSPRQERVLLGGLLCDEIMGLDAVSSDPNNQNVNNMVGLAESFEWPVEDNNPEAQYENFVPPIMNNQFALYDSLADNHETISSVWGLLFANQLATLDGPSTSSSSVDPFLFNGFRGYNGGINDNSSGRQTSNVDGNPGGINGNIGGQQIGNESNNTGNRLSGVDSNSGAYLNGNVYAQSNSNNIDHMESPDSPLPTSSGVDGNPSAYPNGNVSAQISSNNIDHMESPESPSPISSVGDSSDRNDHNNGRCPCGNNHMIDHGRAFSIDRSVLQLIHTDVLSMIGVVHSEIYRLQCGYAQFSERQQLISRILYVDNSFTELVADGISILDEWNQELCSTLNYMENRLNELYASLRERLDLADLLVDLLQTTNRTFSFAPGGPFSVVDGVLSISLDHLDPTLRRIDTWM